MKLDKLYSLRSDFTIIGLTGRMGSGCTDIANLLEGSFERIQKEGLRELKVFDDEVFKRKYDICRKFLSHDNNWVPFTTIRYVDVLLFFILNSIGNNPKETRKLLDKYYKEAVADNNKSIVDEKMLEIESILSKYSKEVSKIALLPKFDQKYDDPGLGNLGMLFFNGGFKALKKEIFDCLESNGGYFRTRLFLHWVSCNLRGYGNPFGRGAEDMKHIFTIANLINQLIKARRIINKGRPTRIAIDSLRNSLEIMFFKERYSAFYMVATKDVVSSTENRINERLKTKFSSSVERRATVSRILELDEVEYRTRDFSKGKFSSPDVENCIQKSDYHIFNLTEDELSSIVKKLFAGNANGFYTREEQLMKLIALILQPGIITPSSAERSMQIANTAKLNSGCISRKVGAAITDNQYALKSIGWNDVAKGHTPCNLRSVEDFLKPKIRLKNNSHYSPFEKGDSIENSSFNYKKEYPGNFKEALIDYFQESYKKNEKDLNGKNCSFCFKTVHNHYEGEANQVHTRSLHAEENAMLQITKHGGIGVKDGILFTTASPCELCAKKAYQLGIRKIYFIDPYPGISVDQILRGGSKSTQPVLIPFYGAIGNAYHQLYETFMPYKDEISMTLEVKPKQKLTKELNNILSKTDDPEVRNFIKNNNLKDAEIISLIKETISTFESKKKH